MFLQKYKKNFSSLIKIVFSLCSLSKIYIHKSVCVCWIKKNLTVNVFSIQILINVFIWKFDLIQSKERTFDTFNHDWMFDIKWNLQVLNTQYWENIYFLFIYLLLLFFVAYSLLMLRKFDFSNFYFSPHQLSE